MKYKNGWMRARNPGKREGEEGRWRRKRKEGVVQEGLDKLFSGPAVQDVAPLTSCAWRGTVLAPSLPALLLYSLPHSLLHPYLTCLTHCCTPASPPSCCCTPTPVSLPASLPPSFTAAFLSHSLLLHSLPYLPHFLIHFW